MSSKYYVDTKKQRQNSRQPRVRFALGCPRVASHTQTGQRAQSVTCNKISVPERAWIQVRQDILVKRGRYDASYALLTNANTSEMFRIIDGKAAYGHRRMRVTTSIHLPTQPSALWYCKALDRRWLAANASKTEASSLVLDRRPAYASVANQNVNYARWERMTSTTSSQ